MARARNIKPSFFINEDLVELPFETRLLFIGLWTLCDRQGYLEDKPKKIKMAIFPADDVDIDKMLNDLEVSGFLIRYIADNRKCIYLPKFMKHQNPHHKEIISDVPRYNPSLTLGKTEADTRQESDITSDDLIISENQKYISELNSVTYCDNNQSPRQALDKPEANPADILIPDSLNLIPDCGYLKDESNDPRFDISLSDVNTRLSMAGLKNISQQDLNVLLIQLKDAYSHKKQMVKNQILGKAFEWVKRQQETPLQMPKQKAPYQTAAQKTAEEHERWRQAEREAFGGRDVTPKKFLLIEEVGRA